MSGLDLLEDTFPHGTLEGVRRGCKSRGACSGAMKCVDLAQRYAADWGFKKALDAGEPVEAILAREEAAQPGVRARDKAAQAGIVQDQRRAMLTRLHAQGLTDVEIARELQVSPKVAADMRRKLDLPTHPRKTEPKPKPKPEHGTTSAYRKGCRCDACAGAMRDYQQKWRDKARQESKAERAEKGERTRARVRELNEAGKLDTEIAAEIGRSLTYVNRLRREMHLPSRRPPAAKPEHGTASRYTKGCRCDECRIAINAYGRARYHRQKQEAAKPPTQPAPEATPTVREVPVEHGTAEGYEAGCRKRSECPAETSCTDAALAAAREKRAAA